MPKLLKITNEDSDKSIFNARFNGLTVPANAKIGLKNLLIRADSSLIIDDSNNKCILSAYKQTGTTITRHVNKNITVELTKGEYNDKDSLIREIKRAFNQGVPTNWRFTQPNTNVNDGIQFDILADPNNGRTSINYIKKDREPHVNRTLVNTVLTNDQIGKTGGASTRYDGLVLDTVGFSIGSGVFHAKIVTEGNNSDWCMGLYSGAQQITELSPENYDYCISQENGAIYGYFAISERDENNLIQTNKVRLTYPDGTNVSRINEAYVSIFVSNGTVNFAYGDQFNRFDYTITPSPRLQTVAVSTDAKKMNFTQYYANVSFKNKYDASQATVQGALLQLLNGQISLFNTTYAGFRILDLDTGNIKEIHNPYAVNIKTFGKDTDTLGINPPLANLYLQFTSGLGIVMGFKIINAIYSSLSASGTFLSENPLILVTYIPIALTVAVNNLSLESFSSATRDRQNILAFIPSYEKDDDGTVIYYKWDASEIDFIDIGNKMPFELKSLNIGVYDGSDSNPLYLDVIKNSCSLTVLISE